MNFKIIFSRYADLQFSELEKTKSKKGVFKQLQKTLGIMETNLKHPSLKTHKFHGFGSDNEVFESYIQNNTPGAYRIFWFYGPNQKEITIIAITPHP